MAQQQRDNSGAVFKNDRKEKDTHPDRTGQAMIGGVEYWVSGWIKQDRNGKQFMSLAFKPKQEARPVSRGSAAGQYEAERRQDARQARQIDDMDGDEVPF